MENSAVSQKLSGIALIQIASPISMTPRDAAVTVSCAVGEDQRLTDCRIISEQPEGSGFGAAALTAATGQKVSTRNGRPVEGRIQATMRFQKD